MENGIRVSELGFSFNIYPISSKGLREIINGLLSAVPIDPSTTGDFLQETSGGLLTSLTDLLIKLSPGYTSVIDVST